MASKRKAPGKFYRQGLGIVDLVKLFDTEEKAEAWFISKRWPDGIACPHCGSLSVAAVPSRKPMPFRCRDCRRHFSVKTRTVLQSSKLPLSKWAIGFYLYMTNLKRVSSMKLHRDLGITQKAAWHMGHRIREALRSPRGVFAGPVEVDETYIGGKAKNMHASKRAQLPGLAPTAGKIPVAGIRDRETGKVSVAVVAATDKPTLHRFIRNRTADGEVQVYSDDAAVYRSLPLHESVSHSVGEYVRGMAHTNGIEFLLGGPEARL